MFQRSIFKILNFLISKKRKNLGPPKCHKLVKKNSLKTCNRNLDQNMGNNHSNSPLAIQALTQVTKFGEEDLFNLRNYCIQCKFIFSSDYVPFFILHQTKYIFWKVLSRGGHDPEMRSILRKDFHTAMKMSGLQEDSSDWELFDCLFTM